MILGPSLVRGKALVFILVPGCVALDESPRFSGLWNGTAPSPSDRADGDGMESVWPGHLLRKCQETASLQGSGRPQGSPGAQLWESQQHWLVLPRLSLAAFPPPGPPAGVRKTQH